MDEHAGWRCAPGAGGVGKTTTAAALAAGMAQRGRRVLVLTIDPARRLAGALGLPETDDDEHAVDLAAHGMAGTGTPARGHARRAAHVRRARARAGAVAGGGRADPAKPDLPAARRGGGRLARVHGDGAALRGVVERALRPDRARHAAVAARARLPRGAGAGDPVRRRAGAAAARAPGRARRDARHARARRRPEPGARRGRAADRACTFLADMSEFLASFEGMYEGFQRRADEVARGCWPRPRRRSCS